MRVRRMGALAIFVAGVAGCGGKKEAPPPSPSPTPLAPTPIATAEAEAEPIAEITPDYPAGTRSLELTRTVSVRIAPSDDAKRIGTIAIDTRVRWSRTATGKGCARPWVEIEPSGWVCGEFLAPSTRPPLGREVPFLDRGELVPGVYGKVTAPSAVTYTLAKPKQDAKTRSPSRRGPVTSTRDVDEARATEPTMIEDKPLVGSVTVRQYAELTVDGKPYWKVGQRANEYVLASAIRQHRPSTYLGARLADDTGLGLPIAFVWPQSRNRAIYTLRKPTGGGPHRKLSRRTAVSIRETVADPAGKPVVYRIGEAEWVRGADVRVFEPAPPPPSLRPGERWIDVDLDNQILVAYEGDLPVYATLVSSGAKGTPTETGVYRMWLKQSESDMKDLKAEDPYSVATVPWTQFFFPERGLALHTAYWHDQFGTPKSHGCINLAPQDARWLYFWSDPQVPPGWTSAAGIAEAPGSIVRVRTKDEPAPPFKGYAKHVLERRQPPPSP